MILARPVLAHSQSYVGAGWFVDEAWKRILSLKPNLECNRVLSGYSLACYWLAGEDIYGPRANVSAIPFQTESRSVWKSDGLVVALRQRSIMKVSLFSH